MDWSSLFSMQKKLDSYIESNHQLENKDVFHDKYLALLVELGELANETRCFKFWSNKPRSSDSVVLEEYVDGIHFILSLGIEKGLYYHSIELENTSVSETEQFNSIFELCVKFNNNPVQENYDRLFYNYLLLGQILGFTEVDIQDAYFKKNEINYERQNQGY
ncbi:dUTPase [Ornithinibacillus sp. L9]|uniref:dUTPase n=1 Tax=Ornithinibacillus caprae TaxID=2678566 RepID=A0A6N8FBI2_9BACI|nr:dUTP diphosphatase [Ornithinibacillus caprae]MUK86900.1 dUTPase [Ornithinibacillus caprae]